eukprot:gnl/TRDRNA2_/TRDRNA2_121042_c3_seq1.p1 gnl/TRDRNA2_/TRDRNA2_121042_c3~~gnl/TRDRNA2_/TRDRNA2_121042_c3_seq1.p1  ORF type:complete len:186 (-),score=26.30 gnl/TRDRNA2_/TRDRNA2_121042_c3_seq1:87-578(-)
MGEHAEAETLYRQQLATQKKQMGAEHPRTLTFMTNLATALHALGQHAEAESFYREVLAVQQRLLGSEHPDTVATMSHLAKTLHSLGWHGQALKLQWEVMKFGAGPESSTMITKSSHNPVRTVRPGLWNTDHDSSCPCKCSRPRASRRDELKFDRDRAGRLLSL